MSLTTTTKVKAGNYNFTVGNWFFNIAKIGTNWFVFDSEGDTIKGTQTKFKTLSEAKKRLVEFVESEDSPKTESLEEIAEKIQNVDGVKSVTIWKKAERERIYIQLPKLNGGRSWNGGKAATVFWEKGQIKAFDWAGAATAERGMEIIQNIEETLEEKTKTAVAVVEGAVVVCEETQDQQIVEKKVSGEIETPATFNPKIEEEKINNQLNSMFQNTSVEVGKVEIREKNIRYSIEIPNSKILQGVIAMEAFSERWTGTATAGVANLSEYQRKRISDPENTRIEALSKMVLMFDTIRQVEEIKLSPITETPIKGVKEELDQAESDFLDCVLDAKSSIQKMEAAQQRLEKLQNEYNQLSMIKYRDILKNKAGIEDLERFFGKKIKCLAPVDKLQEIEDRLLELEFRTEEFNFEEIQNMKAELQAERKLLFENFPELAPNV